MPKFKSVNKFVNKFDKNLIENRMYVYLTLCMN